MEPVLLVHGWVGQIGWSTGYLIEQFDEIGFGAKGPHQFVVEHGAVHFLFRFRDLWCSHERRGGADCPKPIPLTCNLKKEMCSREVFERNQL